MSSAPFDDDRSSPAETAAGFLAAISLAASAIALVYYPVRLAPFAILVALVAVALAGKRNSKLAGAAVAAGTVAWLVGMAIAVLMSRPIY
jgi:hypothetical protein